jgi:hypothetical protein
MLFPYRQTPKLRRLEHPPVFQHLCGDFASFRHPVHQRMHLAARRQASGNLCLGGQPGGAKLH